MARKNRTTQRVGTPMGIERDHARPQRRAQASDKSVSFWAGFIAGIFSGVAGALLGLVFVGSLLGVDPATAGECLTDAECANFCRDDEPTCDGGPEPTREWSI